LKCWQQLLLPLIRLTNGEMQTRLTLIDQQKP
jgi:hypothetical protein